MPLAKTSLSPIVTVIGVATVGIYTNPANTKTFIKAFVIHNAGISSAFCKINDVPAVGGAVGTAASTNQFFSQYINSGETVFLEYPYPLTIINTNHSIRFQNLSTAQPVNIQIIGDRDP